MTRPNAIALAACAAVLAAASRASAVPPAQPNGAVPNAMKSSLPAGSAADAPGSVQLMQQNGSGESGSVTLRQSGPDLVVTLTVEGASAPAQPAHIHEGTCAKLNPAPKYPLSPVTNGKSVTTLRNVTLAQLTAQPYAINVHKSPNDIPTYVACGDIGKSGGNGSMSSGTMMNGSSMGTGTAASPAPSP